MQTHVALKQTSVGDSSSHAWQNSPPPRSVREHADGVQEAFAQPESASADAITKSRFISSPARTRLYQGGLRAGADVGDIGIHARGQPGALGRVLGPIGQTGGFIVAFGDPGLLPLPLVGGRS